MTWLESHLELVENRFERISLVFLVPYALVRVDAMGLPAMEFLAVGAVVLCWCVVVILLLFLLFFAALLGLFVLLVVASTWFAFLL